MRYFLINVKTGLVIGGYHQCADGWRFQPHTTTHQGSRKSHQTRAAASLRYMSPYCTEIQAESPTAASKIAQGRKAAFEAVQPCAACRHRDGGPTPKREDKCFAGASVNLATTLGACAKFKVEKGFCGKQYRSTTVIENVDKNELS